MVDELGSRGQGATSPGGATAEDSAAPSCGMPPADARGCALVLEGGAYRGIFTSGVLDVLMERGIGVPGPSAAGAGRAAGARRAFASVWGTSAGALNAINFRAGQIGRAARVLLAFRDDSRMMSLASLARTGNMAGNDFLYGEVQDEIDPFDNEVYNASGMPVWAVATNVLFGTPAYLPVRRLPDDISKVVASASLPVVSEQVTVGDGRYLDGGTADSVAVEAALGLEGFPHPEGAGYAPAGRAVVVLTQPRDYVKEPGGAMLSLARRRYADYPYLVEAMETRAERYNAQRERIWELERAGRAVVIAPEAPLEVGGTSPGGEALLRAYVGGRAQALAALPAIEAALA